MMKYRYAQIVEERDPAPSVTEMELLSSPWGQNPVALFVGSVSAPVNAKDVLGQAAFNALPAKGGIPS